MSYTLDKTIFGASFEAVEARTREALKSKGFGVLTEIDVSSTMRAKLGHEMAAYRILGACNPGMAWARSKSNPRSVPCCPAT